MSFNICADICELSWLIWTCYCDCICCFGMIELMIFWLIMIVMMVYGLVDVLGIMFVYVYYLCSRKGLSMMTQLIDSDSVIIIDSRNAFNFAYQHETLSITLYSICFPNILQIPTIAHLFMCIGATCPRPCGGGWVLGW